MPEQTKAISTTLIQCQLMCMSHSLDEPSYQALLITFSDGHVEAKCPMKGPRDIAIYSDPSQYRECIYERTF
jgi:hypothetical protein